VAVGERVALRRPRAVIVTGMLVMSMLSASCATEAADEHLAAVTSTLRELQMPVAAVGAMARDSAWRVLVDTGPSPRLYLMHQVAALVLPDGPFELTEPVTSFRFEGETDSARWRQSPRPRGGESLPPAVEAVLATDFVDRERTYFYRIRSIDVRARDVSPAQVAERVRTTAREILRDVAQYRRSGFIGADAEP